MCKEDVKHKLFEICNHQSAKNQALSTKANSFFIPPRQSFRNHLRNPHLGLCLLMNSKHIVSIHTCNRHSPFTRGRSSVLSVLIDLRNKNCRVWKTFLLICKHLMWWVLSHICLTNTPRNQKKITYQSNKDRTQRAKREPPLEPRDVTLTTRITSLVRLPQSSEVHAWCKLRRGHIRALQEATMGPGRWPLWPASFGSVTFDVRLSCWNHGDICFTMCWSIDNMWHDW